MKVLASVLRPANIAPHANRKARRKSLKSRVCREVNK
jgi:hypothetical protein